MFVEKIPDDKGWWYRLPSYIALSEDNQPLPTDTILPHLGHAFGLTELAMWAILVEMVMERVRLRSWHVLSFVLPMVPVRWR
jgi:tetrahydromethanopterin S-methyltransferase subunit E